MPDYPTRMSISATLRLSSSCSHPTCYLQDRDEIADDVIIAISPGTPKPLCESHRNLGTSPHSAIRHKPTSYGRIHTSAFSGHKSLISHSFCSLSRPWSRHFALLDAVFQPHVGQIRPLSSLTLLYGLHLYLTPLWNFFQFLAVQNMRNHRYLVVFSTHCSGLTLRNSLGAFRHKQDFHCCKHDFQIFDNARMSYVH